MDRIKTETKAYSSNIYFLRGDFNSLKDKNTLIDTGGSPKVVNEITKYSTGFGKKKVEQIVLTHSHFDHTGGVLEIKKRFGATVYGYGKNRFVDISLKDGDRLIFGDKEGIILHTPGHSHDSICIYIPNDKILFSGDTPIEIKTAKGSYSKEFLDVLKKINSYKIDRIYPGHGPIINNGKRVLDYTIENVKKSLKII